MKYSKSEKLNYNHLFSLFIEWVVHKIILNSYNLGYAKNVIDSFDRESRCL